MKTFSFYLSLLTGLGLIYIGTIFLLDPLQSEAGFGIHVGTNGNYSFHYIKGIRDLFSGLLIVVLLLAKEYRALGLLALLAVIVPFTDFMIVLSQPEHATARLFPHLIAVVICIYLAVYYLRFKKPGHAL